MTWIEIPFEQRRACEVLLDRKREQLPRAAISRAYYAVYALVASRAPADMQFPDGRRNPSHPQVFNIIDQLPGIPKKPVREALRRLWHSRVIADYGPGLPLGINDARMRLRDSVYIFREIGERTHEYHPRDRHR